MGYRHYFCLVKKEDVDKVRNLSLKELCEKFGKKDEYDEWISFDDVIKQQVIFEFGKLYWDATVERINATGERFFKEDEVVEYFADHDFYIVGKAGVEKAIEIYVEKINIWLKSLLNDEIKKEFEENKVKVMYDLKPEDIDMKQVIRSISDKVYEWNTNNIDWNLDLEDDSYSITNSWLYEYQVFNLVHILKTIDWNTYTLLFYGW